MESNINTKRFKGELRSTFLLRIFSEKCTGHKYLSKIVGAFLAAVDMGGFRGQLLCYSRGSVGYLQVYAER